MQAFIVYTQPFLDVGPKILHDDVRILYQAPEYRHAFGYLEVQGNALFVAMQILNIEPMALAAHAVVFSAAGFFYFDRLRTPIDELAHTGRSRPVVSQIYQFEACKR